MMGVRVTTCGVCGYARSAGPVVRGSSCDEVDSRLALELGREACGWDGKARKRGRLGVDINPTFEISHVHNLLVQHTEPQRSTFKRHSEHLTTAGKTVAG